MRALNGARPGANASATFVDVSSIHRARSFATSSNMVWRYGDLRARSGSSVSDSGITDGYSATPGSPVTQTVAARNASQHDEPVVVLGVLQTGPLQFHPPGSPIMLPGGPGTTGAPGMPPGGMPPGPAAPGGGGGARGSPAP